jgi:hypothetical protein
MSSYTQQHGKNKYSMKKHNLAMHPSILCRWENVNSIHATKEQCQEKSKNRFGVGYGAITNHFGNVNLHKKNDAQHKKFVKDFLLFVAQAYMRISIVER